MIDGMIVQSLKSAVRSVLGKRGLRRVRIMRSTIADHNVERAAPIEALGTYEEACSIAADAVPSGAIVYALGIGTFINTDLQLIERFGARVFGFDPTPESLQWLSKQTLPPEFIAIPYGIADFDGRAQFFQHDGEQYSLREIVDGSRHTDELEIRRLSTVMRELGHDHIDLLKINIEGGEYAVLQDLRSAGIWPTQIWVEFHHRFDGYDLRQTYDAVRDLHAAGYRIVWISDIGRHYTFVRVAA